MVPFEVTSTEVGKSIQTTHQLSATMSSFAGTNSRCFTTFSIDCSPHAARLKGAEGPSNSATPVPSVLARFVMTPGARAGINLSVFTALHIDCWIESLQYILCTINVHMHLILSLSSSYWLHAELINNSLLLWRNKRNIFYCKAKPDLSLNFIALFVIF